MPPQRVAPDSASLGIEAGAGAPKKKKYPPTPPAPWVGFLRFFFFFFVWPLPLPAYIRAFWSSMMGQKTASTMVPTMKPMQPIMMGSMRLVRAFTDCSTCSS